MEKIPVFRTYSPSTDKNSERLKETIAFFAETSDIAIKSGINTESAINATLEKLGKLTNASRCCVFLDEKDGAYFRNSYGWVNPNTGAPMFTWGLFDYEYDLPSLKAILESNAPFFGHTDDLPNDMQALFSKYRVRTILLTPLFRDGNRIGFMGIDFCDAICPHIAEYIPVIHHAGSLVSIVLERKQHQIVLAKLNQIRHVVIDAETTINEHGPDDAGQPATQRAVTLQDAERRIIIETLEMYNGNKLKAAKHLGLTWPSLDRRCKKMGIDVRKH
jgi:Transcriptional regulator containing GAF, AAA-type ATPase, and DNA binding domains